MKIILTVGVENRKYFILDPLKILFFFSILNNWEKSNGGDRELIEFILSSTILHS